MVTEHTIIANRPHNSFPNFENAVRNFAYTEPVLVTGYAGYGANYEKHKNVLKVVSFLNKISIIKDNNHGITSR